MENKNSYAISETCFNLVLSNEEIEPDGADIFTERNIDTSDKELMKNLSRETIVAFLECDDTEVFVKKEGNGSYVLVAYNTVANEAVKISGIGNHFVALIEMVNSANLKRKELIENPNASIIDHDLIKRINEQVMFSRFGECGIGEYRAQDFLGRDVEVALGKIGENGEKTKIECIDLETSKDNNIEIKMSELIEWTNQRIKDGSTMEEIAEFHARFVKIHPFRDGNGRTARLVTNYLLLVSGFPMIDIPKDKKDEYNLCLDYANSKSEEAFRKECDSFREYDDIMLKEYGPRTDETKYLPLAELLSGCFMRKNSKALINNIINYRKEGPSKEKFNAGEINYSKVLK